MIPRRPGSSRPGPIRPPRRAGSWGRPTGNCWSDRSISASAARNALSGRKGSGIVSTFDAVYHDIVPDRRLIYCYDMRLDDAHISASLATIELSPAGAGTRLVFTEQAVFLDGYDDSGSRERGTRILLEQLGGELRR